MISDMPSLATPNLELSPAEMMRMGEACLRAAVSHIAELPQSPRSQLEHAAEIAKSLREPSPEIGTTFDELLHFLMERVFPFSINTAHPAYLGYIPGGGLFPAALAEMEDRGYVMRDAMPYEPCRPSDPPACPP